MNIALNAVTQCDGVKGDSQNKRHALFAVFGWKIVISTNCKAITQSDTEK